MKLWSLRSLLSLIALLLLVIQLGAESVSKRKRTNEAYTTLLYGDEFLLGVRVLGKSIRDTGASKDMVALVSDGVSDYAKRLLEADGWIVENISLLKNPNHVRPQRFWGVYTKLKIFNMTNYKKVVYLDADTIVVKSIEDLFDCGKFCANLKHSERLNSGVMVVEPSATIFNDMITKIETLPSYTGGDQGFLNSYYFDFPNAHVFQPGLPKELLASRPVLEMERLSTLYNADVGLYMLANKWMVDDRELHVIHYTLGPLKPWDWWTYWLVKPVDIWQNVREKLDETLPGTGGGRNPNDALLVKLLFFLPLVGLLFSYYRSFQPRALCRTSVFDYMRYIYYTARYNGPVAYTVVSPSSAVSTPHPFSSDARAKVPSGLGALSVVACLMAALSSLAFALAVVPRQVMPWTGLLLMYEWTFTTFSILFGGFLHLMYLWGSTSAAYQVGFVSSHSEAFDDDSTKVHQRQGSKLDVSVCYYWLAMGMLCVLAPSLPFMFGITALFAKLGVMVTGCIVLAAFMAYASEQLAIRMFVRGFDNRGSSWPRSVCGLC